VTVTTQNFSVSADSKVQFTLTVAGASVQEAFDKRLAELRRKAQLKGFRRGKAPRDLLIRKFGDSLLASTTQTVIEDAMREVAEEMPTPLANPEVRIDQRPTPGQDFTFSVTYDSYPDVELGPYRDLTLDEPQVTIGGADLERELARIQERNAAVVDKAPAAGAGDEVQVARGDVVTVNHVEQDDAGRPVAASERRDFVFEVGTGYNLYEMDEDLIGMGRGAEKVITKVFPADYQHRHLANRTVTLQVTVTAIKEKQLPDLDDELAQDVSEEFETLDDLKADLRRRLERDAAQRVRADLTSQLLERVVSASRVPLPGTMIATDLEVEWRRFAARSESAPEQLEESLSAAGRSKEELLELWRPAIEQRTRVMLVLERLATAERIEIGDEELDAAVAAQAAERDQEPGQYRARLEQAKLLDHLRTELRNQKLYDRLLAANTVRPGKATAYLDLVEGNQ
jgi:trigger factor